MSEVILKNNKWMVQADGPDHVLIYKEGKFLTSFGVIKGQITCHHKIHDRVPLLPVYITKLVRETLIPSRAVVKLNGQFVTDHPNKNYAIKAAKEVSGSGVVTVHLKDRIIWSKELVS